MKNIESYSFFVNKIQHMGKENLHFPDSIISKSVNTHSIMARINTPSENYNTFLILFTGLQRHDQISKKKRVEKYKKMKNLLKKRHCSKITCQLYFTSSKDNPQRHLHRVSNCPQAKQGRLLYR